MKECWPDQSHSGVGAVSSLVKIANRTMFGSHISAMRFPNPVITNDAEHIVTRYGDRIAGLRDSSILITGAAGFLCYFVAGLLLILISQENGEAFNLGTDEEISIATAAEVIAQVAGDNGPLSIEYAVNPDKGYLVDNPSRRCPDLLKVRARIGWSPVSFPEGITRTIRSYRL